MNADEPENDEPMRVQATWNKRLLGLTIVAFADRSYLILVGSKDKIPLIEIGWNRWHPNFIEFERWGWGQWPRRAGR